MRLRNDISVSYNTARKRWLVRWHGKYDLAKEKQQRFGKSFKRKKDAERFAQSLKTDIEDGISIEPQKITLQRLCSKFLSAYEGNVSHSTLSIYKTTIERLTSCFCPYTPIKRIKNEDAMIFLNNIYLLKKGKTLNDNTTVPASDSIRHRTFRCARRIFNVGKGWGYLRKNPFEGINLGRIKTQNWHYITPEQYKNIIKHTPSLKMKGFYAVMYGCGLRMGEAINLLITNGNIDFQNNQVNIINRPAQKLIPPFFIKDYEARTVPAPKWVMDILEQLRDSAEKGNPFVFLSGDRFLTVQKKWHKYSKAGRAAEWKNSILLNNYQRSFKRACCRAGVVTQDWLMVHCLRKSYGTNLANLGTPAHTLKELMGHSSIVTTQKYYLQITDANRQKAVEGLDRIMSEGKL